MELRTEVFQRHSRIDQVGQRLPDHLTLTGEGISPGLASRLHRYAFDRLQAAGFGDTVRRSAGLVNGLPRHTEWPCTVYTMCADSSPANRFYCVRWENTQGGSIEVTGILTRKGWPFIDHGLAIGDR